MIVRVSTYAIIIGIMGVIIGTIFGWIIGLFGMNIGTWITGGMVLGGWLGAFIGFLISLGGLGAYLSKDKSDNIINLVNIILGIIALVIWGILLLIPIINFFAVIISIPYAIVAGILVLIFGAIGGILGAIGGIITWAIVCGIPGIVMVLTGWTVCGIFDGAIMGWILGIICGVFVGINKDRNYKLKQEFELQLQKVDDLFNNNLIKEAKIEYEGLLNKYPMFCDEITSKIQKCENLLEEKHIIQLKSEFNKLLQKADELFKNNDIEEALKEYEGLLNLLGGKYSKISYEYKDIL